jgi:hypothetical protein
MDQPVYVTVSLTVEDWLQIRRALKNISGELGGDFKSTVDRVINLIMHRVDVETAAYDRRREEVIEEDLL